MTTAHRPTWKAAVGRANEGGFSIPSAQKSVLDENAHTKLKLRHDLENIPREEKLRRAKEKLEAAERKIRKIEVAPRVIDSVQERQLEIKLLTQSTGDVDDVALQEKYDDKDDEHDDDGDNNGGWSDVDEDDSDDDLSEDSDDESDDEDEEAALQAELVKIRKERELQKAREEAQRSKEEESKLEEAALVGNPLIAGKASGRVKRRWNDDVVFRNQAKGEPERNKKRFINDTVRNDFHKRFLNKFIR
mmetsp:Transcript_1063/g.1524  ORF Transcript_1063/g.1524 Transcript_1063/m.1524 type:complete len:247 (-) Transcript_1063:282-1022(-)